MIKFIIMSNQNPFIDDEVKELGNPFGSDAVSTSLITAASLPLPNPSNKVTSNNPFASDIDSTNIPPAPSFTISPVNVSRTLVTGMDGSAFIPFNQGLEILLNIGFIQEVARPSLISTGNVKTSFEILCKKASELVLLDAFGSVPSMWKSPISVRVGKLLCNISLYFFLLSKPLI